VLLVQLSIEPEEIPDQGELIDGIAPERSRGSPSDLAVELLTDAMGLLRRFNEHRRRSPGSRTRLAREALGANVDWTLVLTRSGALATFALACAWVATRAFRSYQRSI
jgi:hypothetical protein